MALRFNPPPGWPPAPPGWIPPDGWVPDPSLPPAPPGWQLVVDDATATVAPPIESMPGVATSGVSMAGASPAVVTPRRGGWLVPTLTGVGGLVVGLLLGVGIAGGPGDAAADATPSAAPDDDARTDPSDDPSAADEPTDVQTEVPADASGAPSEIGTRSDPYPVGTPVELGDWTVTLGPSNTSASTVVLAENSFNDPPEAGHEFVLVPVTVTYTGDETGTPWIDLSLKFVGSAGNTFDDSCGVIPDPVFDVGDLYPDASATANDCVAVPVEQIDGGVWVLEETFSFDGDAVFFSLT